MRYLEKVFASFSQKFATVMLIVLVTFAFFGFLGCNNKTEPQPPETFEFNPEFLKVGNSWTYDWNSFYRWNKFDYIGKGSVTDSITKIEEEGSVDGRLRYNLVYTNNKTIFPLWYSNGSGGYKGVSSFYYDGFSLKDADAYSKYAFGEPLIFKKYHIGEKNESTDNDDNTTTRIINSVNVSVTVPAGTFSCIEIKDITKNKYNDKFICTRFCYINPQYGIIKDTIELRDEEWNAYGTFLMELKSKNFQ